MARREMGSTRLGALLLATLVALACTHPVAGQRPNFIIIMIDDAGYDDIAAHHYGLNKLIETPNLDRLAAQSTELSNFYVTPLCSPTRASLLTGRNYLKTGIWGVEGGKDYLNLTETTMADIFADAGYEVIQTGKWHSGKTDGYLPVDRGFTQQIWAPYETYYNSTVVDTSRRTYETQGWTTEMLGGDVSFHVQDQSLQASRKPFVIMYTPHSIHRGVFYSVPGKSGLPSKSQAMHAPPEYVAYFQAKLKALYPSTYKKVFSGLPKLYAELKFLDVQVGRVLDAVDAAGAAGNTYVMVMGDNGPALTKGEDRGLSREIRIPSNMRGSKFLATENGVRTLFYLRGPGIPAGVVKRQLASVEDILPTMVSLAGISAGPHLPWDGKDLAGVLRGGAPPPDVVERKIFMFESHVCGLHSAFLFDVDPVTRRVAKPQPKLDWFSGSNNGKGFARCTAVRYKEFKLMGGKLYRFLDDANHDEKDPANWSDDLVMKSQLEAAAVRWWYDQILTEPGSFEKPVARIGHADSKASQVFVNFAHDMTPARVAGARGSLGFYSVKGFAQDGDYVYIRQQTAAADEYQVSLVYSGPGTSPSCSMNMAVGSLADIQADVAPRINFALPARARLASATAGTLDLPATPPGETQEIKLWMECLDAEVGNGQNVFSGNGLHYLLFYRAAGTVPGIITDPLLDQLEVRGSKVANMDELFG